MSKRIKGKDVNLLVNGQVVAASTSCTFTLTANTADAASKTDPGDGLWDNPEFTHYGWQMGNESFVTEAGALASLLTEVISGDARVEVQFQAGTGLALKGQAIVTQLSVSAANGEKATLSLSLEGATTLTTATSSPVTKMATTKVDGKALMLAIEKPAEQYHTIAAAKSHTLTVSVQTADAGTKDDMDGTLNKEVTGKSVTLSTDNLVALEGAPDMGGLMLTTLLTLAQYGSKVNVRFGYYPASKGTASGSDEDWGGPEVVLVEGSFMCTSLNVNGAVKEDATYSAEFASCGEVRVQ